MSNENLNSEEAKQKLKHLIDDIKVAMMVTGVNNQSFNAVPMTTKKVDHEGSIWFLSLKNSDHNRNIEVDNRIHLLYSSPSIMEFVSVSGTGIISEEREILEELFEEDDENWIESSADPNLTAIKFIPDGASYWDTQTNKYQALYKLGIAAITGEDKEKAEKGKINL